MVVAAGYIRVSNTKNRVKAGTEIESPETQRSAFEAFCKSLGWTLDQDLIIEDLDFSGYKIHFTKRPGLMALIEAAKAGRYDKLLVYKFSRLSRRAKEFHEITSILADSGVDVVSVTELADTSSPQGRLLRGILADFAQFQSEELGQYIRDNLTTKAKNGLWRGGKIPFGYRISNDPTSKYKLVADPVMSKIVEVAFDLAAEGVTTTQIIHFINNSRARLGLPPDFQISKSSLWYILSNPIYTGVQVFSGEKFEVNDVERLVDPGTFEKVQQHMSERFARKSVPAHLLTSVLVCSKCGSSMRTTTGAYYGSGRTKRYSCPNRYSRRKCTTPILDMASLHKVVINEIKKISKTDPEDFYVRQRRLCEEILDVRSVHKEVESIKSRLKELDKVSERLLRDYYDLHMISREQFEKQNAKYLDERKGLEKRLADLDQMLNKDATLKEQVENILQRAVKVASSDSIPYRDLIRDIRVVVNKIVAYDDHIELNVLYDKVDIFPTRTFRNCMFFD